MQGQQTAIEIRTRARAKVGVRRAEAGVVSELSGQAEGPTEVHRRRGHERQLRRRTG